MGLTGAGYIEAMRVLQVEDDLGTAKSVEQMLGSMGHTCETTSLGERALDLATRGGYDIILLDIMLPDIDGYEVLRRLHDVGVETPVLIQTGLVDRDPPDLGLSLGFADYLVKPFGLAELTDRMEAALAASDKTASTRPAGVAEPNQGDTEHAGDPNRREHPRHATLKSGTIVDDGTGDETACVVMNLSDSGAALRVNDGFVCPQEFTLKIQSEPTRRCQVCWRHGAKIGVKFLT